MKGILLMAYGSPSSLDQISDYFTSIRRGRRPAKQEIEELAKRYMDIGGISPLNGITNRQIESLRNLLKENGSSTKVYVGMKHSKPFISETAEQISSDGINELLCIPLVPFYSVIGTDTYFNHVKETQMTQKTSIHYVKSWNTEEGLIEYWAKSIEDAYKSIPGHSELLFTAHSLPITDLDNLETYKSQLNETAELIASKLGIKSWSLSFQSVGMSGGNWLGPTIYDHINLRLLSGAKNFVIAPIGFVSDNLETLYDAGIKCRDLIKDDGGRAVTASAPNDSKMLIGCLYKIAERNGFL